MRNLYMLNILLITGRNCLKTPQKNSDAQRASKERFLSSSDENKRLYLFKSRRKAELAAPALLPLSK